MHDCNFEIVANDGNRLVIRDLGPWDKFKTITNGADELVPWLHQNDKIADGKKLYYYDSSGDCDEIIHADGQFVRFAPGPR